MGVVRADVRFRIRLFQYRECYRISSCRLSQFTIWVRGFPHYKADNMPYNLRLGRRRIENHGHMEVLRHHSP
jgi:hypothetical protein